MTSPSSSSIHVDTSVPHPTTAFASDRSMDRYSGVYNTCDLYEIMRTPFMYENLPERTVLGATELHYNYALSLLSSCN